MRRPLIVLVAVAVIVIAAVVLYVYSRAKPPPTATRLPSFHGFETRRVSSTVSPYPQGETEVLADDVGHVLVVWMDGSPLNQARMTLRVAHSADGGVTFVRDRRVAPGLILADPSLTSDERGTIYLATLHKRSPFTYRDLAVVVFRSSDFGQTWSGPVEVNAEGAFNDRPWAASDAHGRLHVVYGRRVRLPDGNYQRPVYHQMSSGGESFTRPTLVNGPPPALPGVDAAGGGPRGIDITTSGQIVLGYQVIPRDNKRRHGAGTFRGPGAVIISRDGGGTFDRPVPFTTPDTPIVDARDDELGPAGLIPLMPFPRIKAARDDVVAVWIGEHGETAHSVYVATLRGGQTSFDAPVAVTTQPAGSLTLATLATDHLGKVHVLWLGKRHDGQWSLFHASSSRGGDFTTPEQVTDIAFPMEQWPGDFISATATVRDLYVAWSVAGGPDKGVYISIARATQP